jgi:predicted branched-subunit amino acid permease
MSAPRTVAMAAPAALAIAVFGVLYGAAARPLIGPELTMLSSVVVFSGATQFTAIGLVAAGAGGAAILATVALLNVRHLLMGAVLRSSLGPSRLKRALLAWFLLDESFGFTMVAAERTPPGAARIEVAERTLLITGLCCYGAWLIGTALGILGAGVQGLEELSIALFPVLFIALAALTARTLSLAARAVVAAAITAVMAFVLPDLRALAPVVAGLLVAIPNDPRRGPDR